jgi:threonine dehydratase
MSAPGARPRGLSAADVHREVEAAAARITPYVRETPFEPSPGLSRATGARVFLKMENLQVTGSFKARGAFNVLLATSREERAAAEVVTASSGNHAMAMAHAMNLLGVRGEIWLSSDVSPAKLDALRSRGAPIHLEEGADPGGIEVMARAAAAASGRRYISPYNDPHVVGGQGTIALELLRQAEAASRPDEPTLGVHAAAAGVTAGERLDAVFVPVGGGGLIAGIAGCLKAVDLRTTVVGCLPANSPVIAESVRAGRIIDIPWEPSLSDATVGLVDHDSITFPPCRDCVDEWVLSSEDEIAAALRLVMGEHWVMVEGAAVLSVAALLATRERWAGKTVALVLSGSRIPLAKLAAVLAAG